MYQPPHFQETRQEILHGLVRAHPLGLLISNGAKGGAEGPVANAIPFLLDAPSLPNADVPPKGRLRAHLAKANPQWRLLADSPLSPVLVVFQGTDAYVTPSWYETKRETGKVVPTWNYAIVQVRGMVRVIEDRDWLARQISDLTMSQEGAREAPWAVTDAPPAFIQSQIKGIVGLEIEITDISGKWKVSQNRPAADRVGVAEGLESEGKSASSADMAGLVRSYGGIESQ
ncbi:FMN-binding negative transcriptional regulator [Mesorhizobium metallidurans STM 2683]|uniref:FMN-binding negative transcriptional regulator n=1 Tax=Mesorhizobium metallidurans STM 2683 TaxID=1297569 RepID=M5ER02_9HYPH|nr:FMN-binding negative transcriptional regulator [Mesorhizobium metallidurans]CCV06530.1 FMN-binding negative transcriptional regulator [Mesorhizobium metallidurans STM 2683]